MKKFARSCPKVVSSLMPFLQAQIRECEHLRGSGADAKLRGLYEELKKAITK